jgi:hypothetical protein
MLPPSPLYMLLCAFAVRSAAFTTRSLTHRDIGTPAASAASSNAVRCSGVSRTLSMKLFGSGFRYPGFGMLIM